MALKWEEVKKIFDEKGSLKGSDLKGAKLKGADLKGVDLSGADLSGADLANSNFEGANLSGVIAKGANFKKANLAKTFIEGADFSKARLQGAKVEGSKWTKVNFSNSDLSGLEVNKSEFSDVNFRSVIASESMWREVRFSLCNFAESDFSIAKFEACEFYESELTKADLYGIEAKELAFVKSNLERADFSGAKIEGLKTEDSKLERTNFKGVKGLEEEQLKRLKSQGALISSLVIRKLLKKRPVQVALAIFVLAMGVLLWLHFSNPRNWSRMRIQDTMYRAQGRGDLKRAERLAKIGLEKSKGTQQEPIFLNAIASIYMQRKQYAEAEKIYRQISKDFSQYPTQALDAEIQLAQLESAQNPDMAIERLRRAATEFKFMPDIWRAYESMANIYLNKGDAKGAMAVIEDFRDQYKDDPAMNLIGEQIAARLLDRQQQYEKAAELMADVFNKAQDEGLKDAAWFELAWIYIRGRMYDQFEAHMKKITPTQKKRKSDIMWLNVEYQMQRGNRAEAKKLLKEIVYGGGQLKHTALHRLIWMEMEDENLKQAADYIAQLEADYKKSKPDIVDQLELMHHQVELCRRTGDIKGASRIQEEAYQISKKNLSDPAALVTEANNLAFLYMDTGQDKKLEKLLEELEETTPDRLKWKVSEIKGHWAMRNQRFNEASSYFLAALKSESLDQQQRCGLKMNLGWSYSNNRNLSDQDFKRAKTLIAEIFSSDECPEQKISAIQAMVDLLTGKNDIKGALKILDEHESELSKQLESKLWMFRTKSVLLEESGAKPDSIIESYEQARRETSKESEQYFDATMGLAQLYQRLGRFDKACLLFKEVAASDKAQSGNRLEAMTRHIECLLNAGSVDQAKPLIDKWKNMIEKSMNKLDYLPQLARTYVKLGQLEDAAKTFETAISTSPAGGNKEGLAREYAEMIWRTGRRAEAIAKYREILGWCNNRGGDCLEIHVRLAQMLWENGDQKGAEEALSSITSSLKPTGETWMAYSMLAEIKRASGDREGAVALLSNAEKAIKEGSDELCQLRLQHASLLMEMNKPQDAYNISKTAAINAKSVDCKGNALLWQVEALRARREYDKALALLNGILAEGLSKEIAKEANLRIGFIYQEKGEIDKAKYFYRQLIDSTSEPAYKFAYSSSLAMLLFNTGKADEAKAIYEKILPDPNVPFEQKAWSYVNYLELLTSGGFYKDAVRVVEGLKPAQFEPQIRVEILVRYGEALIKDKQFDKAEAILTDALKLNPNPDLTNRIRAALANVYSAKGKHDSSMENYQKLASLPVTTPQGATARYELATLYMRAGKLTEAEDLLNELYNSPNLPSNVDRNRVIDMLFECLSGLNRGKEIEALLSGLAKKTGGPQDEQRLHAFWARYYERTGRSEQAYGQYEKLIKNKGSPYYLEALNFIANYRLKSEQIEDAVILAKSALTDKNLPPNYNYRFTLILAQAYRELGQLDEAKKLLSDWLKVNEKSAAKPWLKEVYIQLGHVENSRQNYNSAIAYYKKAAEFATTASDKAWAELEIARAYVNKDKLDEAERIIESSNKLLPQDVELNRQIIDLRMEIANKRGEPEQVIGLLDRLEKGSVSREELVSIVYQKSVAYRALNKQPERIKTLEQLTQLLPKDDPRRLPALMELAEIYVNTGQQDKAENIYAHVANGSKADPTTGWAKIELANTAIKKGDWERAKKIFTQIMNEYEQADFLVATMSEFKQTYLNHNRKGEFISICQDLTKTAKSPDIKLVARTYLIWLESDKSRAEQAKAQMNSILNELGSRSDLIAWEAKLTAARLLNDIGDKAGAILKYQDLAAQARQRPWSTTARMELAKLLEERGHFRESLAIQKQLLKMVDPTADLNMLMDTKVSVGRLYAKLGEHQKAIESYIEVADREPDTFRGAKAKEEMAYSLFALGKNNEAERIWKELLQKFSADPEMQVSVRMRLGELYITTRRYAEAEKVYSEVIDRYKKDWRYGFATLNLSKALYGQGKVARAKELVEQILKTYKDDKLLNEAQDLLSVINSGAPLGSKFGGEKRS